MRPTKLFILVHPHYHAGRVMYFGRNPKWGRFYRRRQLEPLVTVLTPRERELAESEEAEKVLLFHNASYRFYKNLVDSVKKQRGAHLVIVRGSFEDEEGNRKWVVSRLVERGMNRKEALAVQAYCNGFQEKLVRYARKLGDRFTESDARPSDFASWLKKHPKYSKLPRETPSEVWGEYEGVCTSFVRESMRKGGFANTRINSTNTLR